MKQTKIIKQESGFTMIELLVTLIILSIGLLGLAALQANSMTNNHNAYLKSQATILANDMSDRLRANIVGVRAGSYNNINGIAVNPGCITVGCTSAQMAAYDSFEWNTTLSQQLPAGQGTVVGNGATFVITVRWDEARNGANGTGCDPANAADLKCAIMNITL